MPLLHEAPNRIMGKPPKSLSPRADMDRAQREYQHTRYPFVLYRPDGSSIHAKDEAHEEALKADGWEEKYYPPKPKVVEREPSPAELKARVAEAKADVAKEIEAHGNTKSYLAERMNEIVDLKDVLHERQKDFSELAAAHEALKAEHEKVKAELASTTEGRDAALQKLADANAAKPEDAAPDAAPKSNGKKKAE